LAGKQMDFVDVHGYRTLDLLDGAVRGLRQRFPASTVVVGEIGYSAADGQAEREQADYIRQTLQTTGDLRVPLVLAWELYDDPRTPPHPNSIAMGYLVKERAKPAFGVLCSRWSLVPDCGTLREASAPQPSTVEVSANFPVRPGVLTSNAILRGDGTVRLVVTELDSAGRELATTLSAPVAVGAEGLDYLRHQTAAVRLRDDTRSARVVVRAEGATRLQVDALTAAVR
jgi:hypothetical protein